MSQSANDTILQFFDNYVPSLGAGDYSITFHHYLSVAPKPFPAQQSFTVQGPQVSLPPDDVLSVYPPANATGQFAEDLPHVVLTKRVLPWERKLHGQPKQIPWVALLTFTEDELMDATNRETLSLSVAAGSFSQPAAGVVKPSITIEADIDLKTMCNVIHVNGAVLQAILPNATEIKYLAHVRQVSMTGKEDLGLKDDGWFSVVIANRFPYADKTRPAGVKNIAHLVSLEGWDTILNDATKIDVTKTYELISLHGWSFNCQPDKGETFTALVENFVNEEKAKPADLMLKLNRQVAASDTYSQQVTDRLNSGYVPLAYRTREAETTYAWYRGPLVPKPTTLFAAQSAFLSSAAATIFDKTNGLFDLTYATAWQAGQAIALSDKIFSQAVFRFRKHGHQITDLIAERSAHDPAASIAQLLSRSPHTQKLVQFMQNSPEKAFAVLHAGANQAGHPMVQPTTTGNPQSTAPTTPLSIESLMANPELQDTLADELKEELNIMGTWLADLHELRKVPFNHLVADERMLEKETLRFFYVDNNWIELLCNGALSVGTHSTRDTEYISLMKGAIRGAVNDELQKRWRKIDGMDFTPANGRDAFDLPVTGLLIRSALIAGWPGLVIKAFQNGTMLKNIRMETLSPNVLLCLFLGVPDSLVISEPQHSLRFGVDDTGSSELRQLTAPVGAPLKRTITIKDPGQKDHMRKDKDGNDTRVINISSIDAKTGLAPDMITQLGTNAQNFGAAAFAIQMVQAPKELTFNQLTL